VRKRADSAKRVQKIQAWCRNRCVFVCDVSRSDLKQRLAHEALDGGAALHDVLQQVAPEAAALLRWDLVPARTPSPSAAGDANVRTAATYHGVGTATAEPGEGDPASEHVRAYQSRRVASLSMMAAWKHA
jgi:hypothetical protein